MKSRFFLLIIIALLFSGCGITYPTIKLNEFKMGKSTLINARVFQTLKSDFGLAESADGNPIVIAIKSESEFYPMFDGQAITGQVVMVDTYTYETVPDEKGRSKVKTVPVVVPSKEYKALK